MQLYSVIYFNNLLQSCVPLLPNKVHIKQEASYDERGGHGVFLGRDSFVGSVGLVTLVVPSIYSYIYTGEGLI